MIWIQNKTNNPNVNNILNVNKSDEIYPLRSSGILLKLASILFIVTKKARIPTTATAINIHVINYLGGLAATGN